MSKAIEEAKARKDWPAVLKFKIAEAKERGSKKRGWVVLRKSWLTSSINYRMQVDERAAFVALIILADEQGPVAGLISDNDLRPMPYQFLAELAHIPLEIFESCIKKGIEDDSLFNSEYGLFITHFDDYQFTQYDRQKKYRQAKGKKELIPEEQAEINRENARRIAAYEAARKK